MDKLLNLTEFQLDSLREVGNIGVGNAATALSKLIGKSIKIVVPETKFILITEFSNEFGGPDKKVCATYLKITGDLNGESMLLFSEEDALGFAELLLGKPKGSIKEIDKMGKSALMEMSNIFAGAYLNALSNLLGMAVLPSIPQMTVDMVQAVLDFILAQTSTYANKILAVKTKINIEEVDVLGEFVMFFEVESYQKILKGLVDKFSLN
ncbi:MAG: chemotaxis protein CheC [archaeon]